MASHHQPYDLILSDCYFYSLLLISIKKEFEVLSCWIFTHFQPRWCFIRIMDCQAEELAEGSHTRLHTSSALPPSYGQDNRATVLSPGEKKDISKTMAQSYLHEVIEDEPSEQGQQLNT